MEEGAKIDKLIDLFIEFKQDVNERFDRMDKRFDQIDVRLNKMDKRFDQIDVRLNEMDKRFDQIDVRLDQMDERFDQMDKRLDQMDVRMNGMDDRITQNKTTLDGLIEIVLDNRERLTRIEETMATKAALDKIIALMDHFLGVCKKTDQEQVFTGVRVKRVEKKVYKNEKNILKLQHIISR
jgi:chromosome segregation ATPase